MCVVGTKRTSHYLAKKRLYQPRATYPICSTDQNPLFAAEYRSLHQVKELVCLRGRSRRVYKLADVSEKRRVSVADRQEAGSALGCWGLCRNKGPDSQQTGSECIFLFDLVVITARNDRDCFFIYGINKPVCIINAPRPEARQILF